MDLWGLVSRLTLYGFVESTIYAVILTALVRFYGWSKGESPAARPVRHLIATALLFFCAIQATRFAVGINARPALQLSIDRWVVGKTDRPTEAYLLLVASVRNLGAASIAEGYKLSVTLPDGSVRVARRLTLPDGLTFHDVGGKNEIAYRTEDLTEKTLELIPRGGMARGRLLFCLENIQGVEAVNTAGVSYELEISDAWGQVYTDEVKWRASRSGVVDYPGLVPQESPPEPTPPHASPSPTI